MLRSAAKLLLVFLTLTFFIYTWITGQLGNTRQLTWILILSTVTILAFLLLNLWEQREKRKRRQERESKSHLDPPSQHQVPKRSDSSFSLREKKSGLTWGGGNIKASEAKRGTRRKFLGK